LSTANANPRLHPEGVGHRSHAGRQETAASSAHSPRETAENPETLTSLGRAIVKAVEGSDYIVKSVKNKEKRRNPVPPFIPHLQQEAGP